MPTRRSFISTGAALIASPAIARTAEPSLQKQLASSAPSGQPVRIAPGTVIRAPLRLPDGSHLVGSRSGEPVSFAGEGAIIAEGGARITLENLSLDGSGAAGEGLIVAQDVADLRLIDCILLNGRANGVVLRRCGGRIAGSAMRGFRQAAIYANDAVGLAVEGNTIVRCGENGIQIHRSVKGFDGSIVRANRIGEIRADPGGSGEYGNGINTFRAGGVIIEGNVIRGCAYSAVRNNGGSNVLISGNVCTDAGETALYAEFAFDGTTFTGNIVEGAMTGISIANFGNAGGRLATVSGNLLRNLVRRPHPADRTLAGGVGISVEADASISGNTIDRADYAGIAIGWGPYLRDVNASGNTIRDAATGVMVSVAPGAGSAAISNNLIAGARLGAVVGMAWDKPATGDLTKERPPAQVSVTGNVVR